MKEAKTTVTLNMIKLSLLPVHIRQHAKPLSFWKQGLTKGYASYIAFHSSIFHNHWEERYLQNSRESVFTTKKQCSLYQIPICTHNWTPQYMRYRFIDIVFYVQYRERQSYNDCFVWKIISKFLSYTISFIKHLFITSIEISMYSSYKDWYKDKEALYLK